MPARPALIPPNNRPAAREVHLEQLCKILMDQEETCTQLAACAQEQQQALRQGDGPGFVRSSLTQAHLARRLYFLEEERMAAVDALAHSLSEDSAPDDLATLLEKLPEADSERLAARSRDLQASAQKAAAVQRVNAQMVQTNIQLAAALTRQLIDPSSHYYAGRPVKEDLPASKLDQRI